MRVIVSQLPRSAAAKMTPWSCSATWYVSCFFGCAFFGFRPTPGRAAGSWSTFICTDLRSVGMVNVTVSGFS